MAIKTSSKGKEVSVRVRDGQSFYTNEVSINVSPTEFIFDFKNITQVQDMGGRGALTITHCPVIISPFQAKNLVDMLSKAVKDYEKKFGKIDKPKAIKKAEKLIEKKQKENTPEKSESYFG